MSKMECKSIYANLVSESQQNDAKISELLAAFKDLLLNTNKTSYDNLNYQKLGKELTGLFQYADTDDAYRVMAKHGRQLFEIIFDVLVNAKDPAALDTIDSFVWQLHEAVNKCKSTNNKDFQMFLIAKSNEICASVQKSKSDPKHIVKFLANLRMYVFEIKDKSLAKPILDLIINLMQFEIHESLEIAHFFSIKHNFYNLKNFSNETMSIVKRIFELAFKIASLDDKCVNELEKFSDHFKGQVKQFPKTVESMQDFLCDNLIFKPIETEQDDKHFFAIVDPFYELVTSKSLPSSKDGLSRLQKCYQASTSDKSLELIDPDSVKFYEQPAKYYLNFHRLVADAVKTRDDVRQAVEKDLIVFIDKSAQINRFIDELQPGGLTIYYMIGIAYSTAIVSSNKFSPELVDKVISLWFNLNEEEPDNDNVKTMFTTTVQLSTGFYPQLLAKKSEKLWEYFFQDLNMFLYPITQTFPYNIEAFKANETRLFELFMSSADLTLLNSSNLLLMGIAQNYYEFFVQNTDKKIMRMFALAEKACSIGCDPLVMALIQNIGTIIAKIDKRSKIYLDRFFEQRSYLKILMNFKSQMFAASLDSVVLSLMMNYYEYLITGLNDDNKTRVLLKEILDIYDQMKGSKYVIYIFMSLRKIGEANNKKNLGLLKEMHSRIIKIKNEEKNVELAEAINSLVDFIEGRSMENISNKLQENIETVKKIDDNLVQQDQKIGVLDQTVTKQDVKLKGLSTKVTDLDAKVGEHAVKIKELDEKTLLNMPVWCKEIRNVVIRNNHDWVMLAQRLNFNEPDIKGWLSQADPFLCMLQEWFIANKTSDAINGLLRVFKELDMKECAQIVDDNLQKIDLESADLFKDKDVDERIVNSPAQVFISYEWSSKKKAQLLRDKLAERLNKDYGLNNEKNM